MQERAILLGIDRSFLLSAVVLGFAACGGRLGDPSDAATEPAPRQEEVGSDSTGAPTAEPYSGYAGFDAGLDATDAQMPGLVSCREPQDCTASPEFFQPGPIVACCVTGTCIFGAQAAQSSCGTPDAQVIAAENYDISCTADSDCTLVAVGDFCFPSANSCATGAISQSALPKYRAEVARTYAAQCVAFSGCPAFFGCCRNGHCTTDACFPSRKTPLPRAQTQEAFVRTPALSAASPRAPVPALGRQIGVRMQTKRAV